MFSSFYAGGLCNDSSLFSLGVRRWWRHGRLVVTPNLPYATRCVHRAHARSLTISHRVVRMAEILLENFLNRNISYSFDFQLINITFVMQLVVYLCPKSFLTCIILDRNFTVTLTAIIFHFKFKPLIDQSYFENVQIFLIVKCVKKKNGGTRWRDTGGANGRWRPTGGDWKISDSLPVAIYGANYTHVRVCTLKKK